uniref:Uncharacterized protein n=1 Tax=Anguilla anguilla TaxID=7936 RepID=A0A0E9PDP2_ANGAN
MQLHHGISCFSHSFINKIDNGQ